MPTAQPEVPRKDHVESRAMYGVMLSICECIVARSAVGTEMGELGVLGGSPRLMQWPLGPASLRRDRLTAAASGGHLPSTAPMTVIIRLDSSLKEGKTPAGHGAGSEEDRQTLSPGGTSLVAELGAAIASLGLGRAHRSRRGVVMWAAWVSSSGVFGRKLFPSPDTRLGGGEGRGG